MALEIKALSGGIGARVHGGADVDMNRLSPHDQEELRHAFAHNSVLLVRDVKFDGPSLIAITRVLGETDIHPIESIRLPDLPEIIEIVHTPETEPAEGTAGGPEEIVGVLNWHADLMYAPVPSLGGLLLALEVPPEGGETAFIDTVLAYEALDDPMKERIEGLQAVYRFEGKLFRARSRAVDDEQFSEVRHPVVHVVPGTSSKALNVSAAALRVDGLDEAESCALLAELNAHAVQSRFQYVHRWQAGDLVVFNNTRALHTAFGHKRKYRRILHRTTLKGRPAEADSYAQGTDEQGELAEVDARRREREIDA